MHKLYNLKQVMIYMSEISIKDALNIAVKNHNEGKLKEAEIIYRKILDKYPENSDALHLLGLIAHQNNKNNEAVKLIEKAIQINSKLSIYHGNLGMVYDALGKEEESARCYIKAIEINNKYKKAHLAHYNLGIFFRNKGEIEKALEHFNKAIELNEDFPDAHWNRSLILLLIGNLIEGWKDYEYRFKKQNPSDSRIFKKPKWDGSSLNGKKILIISEQGYGDNIQFIRYIPLVKERGAYIILECRKELEGLLREFPGIDEIIIKEKNSVPNIDFDYYIHVMSLPAIFNTSISNIPNKVPYIKADHKLVEKFRMIMNKGDFKIGISWAGNPDQENDKNRSTQFEKFKFLKEFPKVGVYSLQKGEASRQLNDLDIVDLTDEINNFSDSAAAIENLDLIITVDTAVAHLAGAMGKPVWTVLTFMPDWRWFIDRNDSPWYPSMKLFRQQKHGDWDGVFNKVKNELRSLLKI